MATFSPRRQEIINPVTPSGQLCSGPEFPGRLEMRLPQGRPDRRIVVPSLSLTASGHDLFGLRPLQRELHLFGIFDPTLCLTG